VLSAEIIVLADKSRRVSFSHYFSHSVDPPNENEGLASSERQPKATPLFGGMPKLG
jgi:hypothetical protein